MGQIIAGHNKKLLQEYYEESEKEKIIITRTCNCRDKPSCPLQGKCLMRDIIYKGNISAENIDDKQYIGLTATTFKERFANHKKSLNTPKYAQSTTLSSYFWQLKGEDKNPRVNFSVLKQSKSFTPEIGKCYLCIAEKLQILKADPTKTINKRSEIMSTCRHKRNTYLKPSISKQQKSPPR